MKHPDVDDFADVPDRPNEASLLVRVWIDAELVRAEWLTEVDARLLSEVHTDQVALADREGKLWLVDVWDPEAPADHDHLRFGTDTAGMVAPIPLPTDLEG